MKTITHYTDLKRVGQLQYFDRDWDAAFDAKAETYYSFVQNDSDIDQFNKDCNLDAPYFLIEWTISGAANKLYAVSGFYLDSDVYFVCDL